MLTNEYKYITMIKTEDKPKTSVFAIMSKHDDIIGEVKWLAPWRQYTFFPEDDCIFSKGCLEDINHFMTELMNLRKNRLKEQ